MTETEKALAIATLAAAIAREHLDSDYAAVQAAKQAVRVTFTPSGTVDESSVAAIVRDVAATADPRWRTNAPPAERTDVGDLFYDKLRATLAAKHAERERQRTNATAMWDRLAR